MLCNDIDIKKRDEKAATLLISAPILKVPQAMRATNFSNEESQNRMLQQRVCCIYKVKLQRKDTTLAHVGNNGIILIEPSPVPMSAVTLSTPTVASSDTASVTESRLLTQLKPFQLTITIAMKIAKNKRALNKFGGNTLKAATKLYHKEQQKKNGMLAKEVEKKIKARFSGKGPCAQSITGYVNKYHLVSTLMLKVRHQVKSLHMHLSLFVLGSRATYQSTRLIRNLQIWGSKSLWCLSMQ
jgi:hypothetical protein